jgi:heme/copper-type cytochrome/quinol oxidase subunit 3
MTAIPYTVERRPDTGVNNVQLGVWLFIASEVMLFGGLFSAYFMLRAGAAAPWLPIVAHRVSGVVNTVLLLAATGAFTGALRMARVRRLAAFRGWMLASLALALLFLFYKAFTYVELANGGIQPSTTTQWATYYLLTGVHALHVLGGLLVNAALLSTSTASWVGGAPRIVNRMEATALYWYFVDAVWLLLFVVLYVV